MKRIYTAISLILLFPAVVVVALYFVARVLQPEKVYIGSDETKYYTFYFEEDDLYEITGDIRAFPGQIIPIEAIGSAFTSTAIHSLSDIENTPFVIGNSYKATICFNIKLPTMQEYGLWFPATVCEYRVYVNGELTAESASFDSSNPRYGNSFYLKLPQTSDGMYEIVAQLSTPINYIYSGSDSLFLGTYERISKSFNGIKTTSLYAFAFIIFTIVFLLIQSFAFKGDKRITSYILLSFMTIYVMSFMDGKLITFFFPGIPYMIGCFAEALSAPLFLLALLHFTHTMYPLYYPEKIGMAFSIALLIPLINALCLGRIAILSDIATMITIVPYAVCLYVFILAYEERATHDLMYGIGILSTEASVVLYYATSTLAIPSRFTYGIGYVVFAIMIVAIFAEEYSSQDKDEAFYSEELSRQLEAMQASENAFLNAQMKPHFLYNTLNTIADCCVTDSPKAKKLINSLSEYLKLILSLDNMDETVPLRRELELVEAYTAIEKERFPSINFYNDFPVRLPSIMMPPITIQPLIENAIKHGVRKSERPGAVTLRIVEHLDSVEFFVSDNGAGMNEETIQKLFKMPKENQSIGIYNIDKRLKNIYGRGLTVESTPGLGTCVSFKVMKHM